MINTATIMGRLTAAPDLQTLPGTDRPVLETRLAVDRIGKDAPTDFLPVTLYGKQAETVAKYSGKGRRIAVTGRIQVDTWGPKEARRSKTYIVAEKVQIVDFPPRDQDPQPEGEEAVAA